MIDLHCHSTFSDGTLSPIELLNRARALNIKCLSLTDHDTLEGYCSLLGVTDCSEVNLISGIELSACWKKHDVHILGYQISATEQLDTLLLQQKNLRIQRAKLIGDCLEAVGIEHAFEKACEIAGHQRVGRPHFAQLLIREGLAKDMRAAFKRFLVRGRCAYVPNSWITLEQAVSGINAAGGQAVLAHPLRYGLTRSKLHELIKEFKAVKGIGIEVVSGQITSAEVQELATLSLKFDLLASSGSDFHGDKISHVSLGGQRALPPECRPIWKAWNIE